MCVEGNWTVKRYRKLLYTTQVNSACCALCLFTSEVIGKYCSPSLRLIIVNYYFHSYSCFISLISTPPLVVRKCLYFFPSKYQERLDKFIHEINGLLLGVPDKCTKKLEKNKLNNHNSITRKTIAKQPVAPCQSR